MKTAELRSVKKAPFARYFRRNWSLYLFVLPALLLMAAFQYAPMYGVQIAFRNFSVKKGFFGSAWVGMAHFRRFFNSPNALEIIGNTLKISLLGTLINFPLPIVLALMLNQLRSQRLKKTVQMITYMPYFISTVVLVGMMKVMFASNGVVNRVILMLGGQRQPFFNSAAAFLPMFILSGTWQNIGYNAIIYLAALASVPPELHESAVVDGASRLRRTISIDLAWIMPTIIIQLILRVGNVMNVSFEKAFLMQTDLNVSASEVISTYVYKIGILNRQLSFSTAVGLFNSVVNFALLLVVNFMAGRLSETSLF